LADQITTAIHLIYLYVYVHKSVNIDDHNTQVKCVWQLDLPIC